MKMQDCTRLRKLPLKEKKALLSKCLEKKSTTKDKDEISALDSIIYMLESQIKDQQIETILDEALSC
jgi:hypothetical protein